MICMLGCQVTKVLLKDRGLRTIACGEHKIPGSGSGQYCSFSVELGEFIPGALVSLFFLGRARRKRMGMN